MAGHPQAAKLKLTSSLPRSPGVYLFCGHRDEVLYVGKATNLRQRVRSYFGSEDRRAHRSDAARGAGRPPPLPARPAVGGGRRGPPDRPAQAAVQPSRHARRPLLLRPPRRRLGVAAPGDRPRPGAHRASTSGRCRRERWRRSSSRPCRPRLPLRRCSVRLGRSHVPAPGATPCAAGPDGRRRLPVRRRRRPPRLRRRRRRRGGGDERCGRTGGRTAHRADAHARRGAALRGGGDGPRPPVGARRRRERDPPDGPAAGARPLRDDARRRHVGRRSRPAGRRPRRRFDRRRAPGGAAAGARAGPPAPPPPRRRGPGPGPPPPDATQVA